ncbi:MAG: conjugal transfer protein TrbF [Caulobacter sp.]|nr:conjugal transfer protein TrbF [Caulobacter sp.]
MAFRRSSSSYGPSPFPETPYQKAGQIWDERIGSARVQAKNWRLAFFGALALSGGLSAGLVWQSARGHIVPWVVQVDRLGEAQAVAPAEAGYRPTDPQIAFHLARFIEQVRAIPADPVIVRQNWLRAYDYVTPKAAGFLNTWAQTHDPFAEVGREAVNVEILNVVRRTARTYDLQWRETRFVNGQQAGAERWRALITVDVQPPKTEAELMKNPLGLKIEDVSWTPDAS